MNIPYIKVIDKEDDRIMISSLQNVVLTYGNDDDDVDVDCFEGINSIELTNGGRYFTLISCIGEQIDISSMKCFSYEEFLIELDLHNCLFNLDIEKTIKSDDSITKLKLMKENAKLKRQLESIKKFLKDNRV